MHWISIDVETYSGADLSSCGVHRYVEDPDFQILLIGYSIDGGPVKVHDCTQPGCWPRELLDALTDPDVEKRAWNAAFERTCFAQELEEEMPPEQWSDTMIMALECGLPGSLAGAGVALGLPEEKLKDPIGKSLIRYFSIPCRPTKANGGRTRNLPQHDLDKWALYIEYNRQDVVTEMAIREKLSRYPLAESEQELWELDQRMNDRGVRLDVPMIREIVRHDEQNRERLQEEAREITGLKNPNSLAQLKAWLDEGGIPVEQLRKDDVDALLLREDLPEAARRMLEIRKALGKTSVAKYGAMLQAVCKDNRLRGILQFYGASRSGRWAGRIVQTHNLARSSLPDLDLARHLAAKGDFDTMETLFGETSFVLSELIRTAFIPSWGCRFVVSDFSAIEARVLAWLAGEDWVLDAFRAGKDIYCETASMMYHVPVVKHGVNGELRQKGKIATLACIAEGQPVLTDQGLVPIEKVTKHMKVWDGVEWVSHGGVIYKGRRKVISYGGLEATADHIVWTKVNGTCKPIRFRDAAASGSHLIQSGAGRNPIWLALHNFSGTEIHEGVERVLRPDGVHRMRAEGVDAACEYDAGQDKRLPELQPAQSGATMAGQAIHVDETTLREPERSGVQELWRAGDPLRVSERDGCLPVHDKDLRGASQGAGDRQDRQQRELCPRKSAMGDTERTDAQPKAVKKVYDILNAGPRHRFTVSGVLVHNCGYQGGVGAMKAMDREGAIPEEELQAVVDQWRAANPRIVKLWRDYEAAAMTAIWERRTVRRGIRLQASGLELAAREAAAGGPVRPYSVREGVEVAFSYRDGNLFIKLPSGRKLCYWGAQVRMNPAKGREEIIYMGVNQTTKQWGITETYGGKIVENVTQATARDCLAAAMRRVTAMGYRIVMHVHDEMIVDVPKEDRDALERINGSMSDQIPWAPGLPLKGDGYECDFYRKD